MDIGMSSSRALAETSLTIVERTETASRSSWPRSRDHYASIGRVARPHNYFREGVRRFGLTPSNLPKSSVSDAHLRRCRPRAVGGPIALASTKASARDRA
eukprot:7268311-Prymnesium_polylepis.1